MDTAIVRKLGTLLEAGDLEIIRRLGYHGLGPIAWDAVTWQHLTQRLLPLLDEYRLKLFAVYSKAQVSRTEFSIDPGLLPNLHLLKGRGTQIWLPVAGKDLSPSDRSADTLAIAAVQKVADEAKPFGLKVSLYPHFGNLMERVSDAVRIARMSARENVGVTFNLCHWLRTQAPDSLDRVLEEAAPFLSMVTINGADRDGKTWRDLIQPLDAGTYDVRLLLRALKRIGYRGPVGLQGFDVARQFEIDPQVNLERSMAAWNRIRRELQ